MISINVGVFVKIFLKNSIVVEGVVEQWGKEIVLRSLREGYIILHHPEDIFMTQLLPPESIQNRQKEAVQPSTKELREQTKKKFVIEDTEFKNEEKDLNLRALELAELRKMQAQEQKELILKQLNAPKTGVLGETEYGVPNLQLITSLHDPTKKSRRGV